MAYSCQRDSRTFQMSLSTLAHATIPTTAILATTTHADITGAFSHDSFVTAEDFGGGEITVFVQDLYLISNDSNDVVRSAFDLLLEPSAQIDYYQAPGGLGWAPSNIGGPFDTDSVRRADSFVTIGGFGDDASTPLQIPGAGANTGLGSGFEDPWAPYPGVGASWFDQSPSTPAGKVHETPIGTLGTFVGRFSYAFDGSPSESTLYKSRISATWNQGLGTPDQSDSFLINWIPSPATLGIFALGGLRGSSRRRD